GVPVLLSIESGLAEYLLDAVSKSIIANDMAEKCLANVLYQSSDDISDDWVARMSSSLSDRQASFARAQTLRAALKPVMTWGNAARDLLNAIENSL
ncbi:MAG: hypothetical protein SGJ23_01370, partial [Alphaproteobacteria bacterium]|nr:hypothetical protein [Alphaproteobacteria bacterium]